MNAAIIAPIIGVLGAAAVGSLTVFLQAIRAEMTAMRSDVTAIRTDMTQVEESLARIEATQEMHSRQLERMADHGERIAALEGAISATP